MNTLERIINGNVTFSIKQIDKTTYVKADGIVLAYKKVDKPKFVRVDYALLDQNKQQQIFNRGWELIGANLSNEYGKTTYYRGGQILTVGQVHYILASDLDVVTPSATVDMETVVHEIPDVPLHVVVYILDTIEEIPDTLTDDINEAIHYHDGVTNALATLKGLYIKNYTVENHGRVTTYTRNRVEVTVDGASITMVGTDTQMTKLLEGVVDSKAQMGLRNIVEDLIYSKAFYIPRMGNEDYRWMLSELSKLAQAGFTLDRTDSQMDNGIRAEMIESGLLGLTGRVMTDLVIRSVETDGPVMVSDTLVNVMVANIPIKFKLSKLGLLERTSVVHDKSALWIDIPDTLHQTFRDFFEVLDTDKVTVTKVNTSGPLNFKVKAGTTVVKITITL